MTTRKIERLLADAGVPEGADPRYLTTARTMFATLAWASMRRLPSDDGIAGLVRNAERFVARYWDIYRDEASTEMLPVYGIDTAQRGSSGKMIRRRGGAYVGNDGYLPSIRARSAVSHVTNGDMATVVDVANGLAEDAIRKLTAAVPGVTFSRDRYGIHRWSGMSIQANVEDNDVTVLHWSSLELLCRDRGELMADVARVPELIQRARERYADFLSRHPEVATMMADWEEGTMMPLRLSLAPNPVKSRHRTESPTMLLLHGYGPGGEAAIYRLGGLASIENGEWNAGIRVRLDDNLKEQRKRHEAFGPRPGEGGGDWEIDLVTSRLLAKAEDGDETLARAIAGGKAKTDDGLELRIAAITPNHRILGRGQITKDATWHGNEIRIVGTQLPEAVRLSMPGRPIDEIVDSPLLKDAGIVTSVKVDAYKKRPRVNIRVTPTMKALELGKRDG